MKITWYGHSCFMLETSYGNKLLTDPFNPSIGYPIVNEKVDIVTISHHHYDHDYLLSIKGSPKIVDSTSKFSSSNFTIEGIQCYHDKFNGIKRGKNIAYIYECDNMKLCHLGDLGHIPDDNFFSYLYNIDVLFIPIGGNFTIDGIEASKICDRIKSRIIIPMHYKTPFCTLPLDGAENFITSMKKVSRITSNSIEVSPLLIEPNTVILLNMN